MFYIEINELTKYVLNRNRWIYKVCKSIINITNILHTSGQILNICEIMGKFTKHHIMFYIEMVEPSKFVKLW
jgi:hypothetical protein